MFLSIQPSLQPSAQVVTLQTLLYSLMFKDQLPHICIVGGNSISMEISWQLWKRMYVIVQHLVDSCFIFQCTTDKPRFRPWYSSIRNTRLAASKIKKISVWSSVFWWRVSESATGGVSSEMKATSYFLNRPTRGRRSLSLARSASHQSGGQTGFWETFYLHFCSYIHHTRPDPITLP